MKSFPILLILGLAAAVSSAQPASKSFVSGAPADEAAIRAIVVKDDADQTDSSFAADLDWENAFGIRFLDLKKRDEWYAANVKPQFKTATETTLEVKVRFLDPSVAVADSYWHVVGQVMGGDGKPGPDRWGRTTYLFKKEDGVWINVLSRVADLRMPYYKHYESIPAAFPVSAPTLASYAGSYESAPGRKIGDLAVAGDHLTLTSRMGAGIAIPASPTEFLLFHPDDVSSYLRLTFAVDASGTTTLSIASAGGEPMVKGSKMK